MIERQIKKEGQDKVDGTQKRFARQDENNDIGDDSNDIDESQSCKTKRMQRILDKKQSLVKDYQIQIDPRKCIQNIIDMIKQIEMTPILNSDGIFNNYLGLIQKGEDQYCQIEEEGPLE